MKTVLAVACLLLLAGLAHSIRTNHGLEDGQFIEPRFRRTMLANPGDSTETEGIGSVEWQLKPSKADGMIAKVKEFKDKAQQAPGYKNMGLSQPLNTNEILRMWVRFDTKEHMTDFFHSPAGDALYGYARDNDIVYRYSRMVKVV